MTPKMQYTVPERIQIEFPNGNLQSIEADKAVSLYLAWSGERKKGNDEDKISTREKFLYRLGGRNEFERTRQKKICDWLATAEEPYLKRVMIIGDSIRMRLSDSTGYGLHAYRNLIGKCNLTHIPHNCGGTKEWRNFLQHWLSCKPELVHINAGLHDLAFSLKGDKPPTGYNSVEQYAENLEWIISTLKANNVKTILWGLNTPVQEEWHRWIPAKKKPRSIGRLNQDIRLYNDASIRVMKGHNIPITDLFTPLWEKGVENVLLADGVHLNHQGSVILGKLVAETISRYL